MAENSAIEWTDHTWTPVVGCDAISPACANCYAALMAARLESMGQEKYAGLATRNGNVGKWTGKVTFWEPDLVKPLTVRKPSRWFLTSMGDVGHDKLTDEQVAELFGVMAVAGAEGPFHREQDGVRLGTPIAWSDGTSSPSKWPNHSSGPHTFMVLSKRSARIAALLGSLRFRKLVSDSAYRWAHNRVCAGGIADHIYPPWSNFRGEPSSCWPMANVFIGCTAENQERADELRPHMASIAAAGWKTFVSYEPALGPVDWTGWEFLQQLISGGESGHRARPSHPDWFRSARDFAEALGIAYLHKQNGEWLQCETEASTDFRGRAIYIDDGYGVELPERGLRVIQAHGAEFVHVGKKAAGRLLDGVEHNGFPA